jgi:hypothetical protein
MDLLYLKKKGENKRNSYIKALTNVFNIDNNYFFSKQKLNLNCTEYTKLNSQIKSLKMKVICLQDELLATQKEIIA